MKLKPWIHLLHTTDCQIHKSITKRISLPALFYLLCFSFGFTNYAKAQPHLTFAPFIQNLTQPLLITNAGDGSGRLFIVEQGGKIKIYKNGGLLSKPFLDLSSIIPHTGGDGVYSLVFAPNYKTNRTFFVYFYSLDGSTKLARFQTSKTNPDSAIGNSGVTLISLPGAGTGGVHVGDMHFGKDGYLYVSFNDGSIYANTTKFAQDGQVLLGKILRLNVTNVNTPPYYTIPPDNPFVNDPNVRDEIWALGLRNAWRWSFDKRTGNMWIADVGGDKWEEIDIKTPAAQKTGLNFGWPCYEANSIFDTTGCKTINNYTFPAFAYPHVSDTSGEVITGGYIYNGSAYPALKGYYVCADYEKGYAWVIKANNAGVVLNSNKQTGFPLGLVGFGEGEDGELYVASLSDGTVYRVQATATPASIAAETIPLNITSQGNLKSYVYPTLVSNSIINIELKEPCKFVRLLDIAGNELMRKILDNQLGRITLNLPRLEAGMYILQLVGAGTLQQKIYVSR